MEQVYSLINSLHNRGIISDDVKTSLLEEYSHPIVFYDNLSVSYKGKTVALPNKMFALLKFMYENRNRYFSQDRLIQNVWEKDIIVDQRTVDVHICKLKTIFPDIPVKNKKRVGYGWMD